MSNIIFVVVGILVISFFINKSRDKKEKQIERLEDKIDQLKEDNSPYRGMNAEEKADIRVDILLSKKKDKSN